MSWSTSGRRQQLPPDWKAIRLRIGARDSWQCQWRLPDGSLCRRRATDCDHIRPGGPNDDENLQMLCSEHHAHKSSGEGGRARAAAERAHRKKFERPTEQHPVSRPATKPRFPGM